SGDWRPVALAGESYRTFIPRPLPPQPMVALDLKAQALLEAAVLALGRLDGIARTLPETQLFLYMYVRKEALLSSQIEGTQSSLSDLLLFENAEPTEFSIDDVIEVSNYVDAMEFGIEELKSLPLSTRLFREIHARLLSRGRGSEKSPGEYRISQNWIGGSRPGNALYVPPPPDAVAQCMSDLERFLNDDRNQLPLLVRVALAHAQFESIHPFLDGNGRLGRLLITLGLVAAGALEKPLLYLSLFFKEHRSQYYELLQRTRTDGDWEAWLSFFFAAVESTATRATETARRILHLFESDRRRIDTETSSASVPRLHELLRRTPIVKSSTVAAALGVTQPTADTALQRLVSLGLLREITGRSRNRLYAYTAYLNILQEGT
ncbi:MAG: Fic family protein, partial [Vulcanimicrobiaceae bacterium]